MNLNDLEREKEKPDIEALSREFCKLAGICWHGHVSRKQESRELCSCGQEFQNSFLLSDHAEKSNPDFTDARGVLKVMRAREDWPEFLAYIDIGDDPLNFMDYRILDTTGLLLIEAVWFLRKEVKR